MKSLQKILTAAMLAIAAPLLATTAFAASDVLGELLLRPATDTEKRAAVWVDGQYLGYIDELKGRRKLLLLPGEHDLKLTLAGYEDVNGTISVEPGERREYRVRMKRDPNAYYVDESQTGQVQVAVKPDRAAVFVNDRYAGHVAAFDGKSGLRVSEGTHKFRVALPGYQPFETELTVRAGQHYKLETVLVADGRALVVDEEEAE